MTYGGKESNRRRTTTEVNRKVCEPCKVVIDGDNQASAKTADRLAEIARGLVKKTDDAETDEALYKIACIEVEHIIGVRRQAMEMAKRIGASDRWIKLMERLYGSAV